MSVAGGVSKAVDRAVVHGCEALQIFTKNANQWRSKPLDRAEIKLFRQRLEETGIAPVVSHASYLINLATTDAALRAQSVEALIDELDRAHALGLSGVVLHPGTCTDGTEEGALRLVAEGVRAALKARPRRPTMVFFEHAAGQGRTLGYRFEHLAGIIDALDGSPRAGVCLDTCHLVASGYDIVSDEGYAQTFAAFDRLVGLGRLHVFHGNDSKRPCGSRIDRHEHIGAGCLGLEPFRRLLRDSRFSSLPILIETEKSADCKPQLVIEDPLDMRNLEMLRRLRNDGPIESVTSLRPGLGAPGTRVTPRGREP
jgi:deoxyribonuclease-4